MWCQPVSLPPAFSCYTGPSCLRPGQPSSWKYFHLNSGNAPQSYTSPQWAYGTVQGWGQGSEVRMGTRFLLPLSFQEARGERNIRCKPLAEGSFWAEDTGTWVGVGDCGAQSYLVAYGGLKLIFLASVSQMLGSPPSSLESEARAPVSGLGNIIGCE